VRGLNKKVRRRDVQEHISKYSPSIACLVETKVRKKKARKIEKLLLATWSHVNNYDFNPK